MKGKIVAIKRVLEVKVYGIFVCLTLYIPILLPDFSNAQSCGFQTTCLPPSDWALGSWQMFNGSQNHTGRQRMKGNFTSGRYIKWTYTTTGNVTGSPAIGDINNDGNIEVVVGCVNCDSIYNGKVYALRGTNGSLLWSYQLGYSPVRSSPAIGDINNDSLIEVVVGIGDNSTHYGRVDAIRGTNGTMLWTFLTNGEVLSSPAIGDINWDGNIEVVVGGGYIDLMGRNTDSTVYVLRGTNGSVLWYYLTQGGVFSSPAIGDLNNGGFLEVVVGTMNMDWNVYALWWGIKLWSFTPSDWVLSSPAIGDINGDGKVEVVVGSRDGKVYALRGTNGALLWFYQTGGDISSSPTIGDINNDGNVEVIVGSMDGYVYALKGTDGSLLWSYYVGSPYIWMNDVVLADIDPSSGMEVITHGDSSIYVLSSYGTLLWQVRPGNFLNSISVGDIDGDGCVEIVAVGGGTHQVAAIDATSNEGGCGLIDVYESVEITPNTNVKVYDVSGRVIYQGPFEGFKRIKGVYFVKGNGKVKKVVVYK